MHTSRVEVLVVEDEPRLAALLARGLREAGHQVTVEGDGTAGFTQALSGAYDAIVLDWMLPGMSGADVVARLRSTGNVTPVLMLTARQGIADRVAGLDAGADDYLVKPFNFDELLARVRALHRRGSGADGPSVVEAGDLRLDLLRRTAMRGETPLTLSAREFDMLAMLARRAGTCVTRLQILDEVWDGETDLRSNVIDVYIAALRSKIDKPFGRNSIRTLRGAGYTLLDGP